MKLVFYNDSPVFGGHEIMTLYAIEALISESDILVDFIYCQENIQLEQKLLQIKTNKLILSKINISTRKLQGIRNHFSNKTINFIGELFLSKSADLYVIIQGDIEISSLGLMVVKKFNLPNVSYIPVPHTLKLMKAKLGGIRDIFNSYLFKLPSSFITISESMRKILVERGVKNPIYIVQNGVDLSRFSSNEKIEEISELIPKNKIILGMVGRIEFKQKRHNLLIEAIGKSEILKNKIHLIIIGDGKDKNNLKALINKYKLRENVSFFKWQDPVKFYKRMDFLVIPSRFEGVPLVMIESIASSTPVIGSNVDGMNDILPKEWKFKHEDLLSLQQTLLKNIDSDNSLLIQKLKTKIFREMSLNVFKTNFVNKIRSLV